MRIFGWILLCSCSFNVFYPKRTSHVGIEVPENSSSDSSDSSESKSSDDNKPIIPQAKFDAVFKRNSFGHQ